MSFTQLADDSPVKSQKSGGLATAQDCDGSLAAAPKPSMADDTPAMAQKCGDLHHEAGQAAIDIEAMIPSLGDTGYGQTMLMSKRSTF